MGGGHAKRTTRKTRDTKAHRMAAGFHFTTGVFKGKEADPKTTRERLDRYLENIERLFVLNRRINTQSGLTIEFTDEEKKNILCVEGGTEMQELFKHKGKVQNDDTYEDAVRKIKEALKKRENRSTGVYRLFTALPQEKQTFDAWHKKILESAKRVEWDNYDYEKTAVDAILIQTSSTKLRQKALQENPTLNQLVDMGMGQEQAQRKAQSMPDPEESQIKALQEKVRKLETERANRGRRSDRTTSKERRQTRRRQGRGLTDTWKT